MTYTRTDIGGRRNDIDAAINDTVVREFLCIASRSRAAHYFSFHRSEVMLAEIE